MPPRHHYWTIILEGKPTAFRAHTEDELLPTLRQLQSRHPDAVLKWFARGRLWNTQEEERNAALARRQPKFSPAEERRSRDWRPGGEHKDPRDRFKVPRDEKRRRFAQNLRRDRPPATEDGQRPPAAPPGVDRPRPVTRPDRPDRTTPRTRSPRPPGSGRPPWNRDGSREEKGQGRPKSHGRPTSRFRPRPPGPSGGKKPGGGKPGGGGGR